MRKLFIFLLFLGILMTSASAENVTVQIFENSDGVYFIEINDGELIECGDSCTVCVDNVTSGSTTLTKEDRVLIGKQVAAELHGQEEMFNTSEHYSITSDIVKGADADLMEWLKKNYMPTVEEFNNLTSKLEEKEAALKVLDAQFKGYDDTIKAHESEIETLKKNMDLYWYLIIILTTTIFAIFIAKTDMIRALKERRNR